ncbi:MAG: hypothetical protein JO203_03365 [Gammaproteobacteria bacterium]|nr:hypothetical protein [Gammaproteobacteria bacterium]
MSAERNAPGLLYERLVLNRRVVTWTHILLGLATAFICLSQLQRPVLFTAKYVVMLPLLPYLISAAYARRLVTPDRVRVTAFILAVILGFGLMASVFLGAFGPVGGLVLLVLFGLQTIAFLGAAEVIFGVG